MENTLVTWSPYKKKTKQTKQTKNSAVAVESKKAFLLLLFLGTGLQEMLGVRFYLSSYQFILYILKSACIFSILHTFFTVSQTSPFM